MLKAELKKFVSPFLFLIAVLISLVLYHTEISFIYHYFPNGAGVPIFNYTLKWQEEFGSKMTDENFQKVEEDYQKLIKETDEIVAASSYGKERNLKSYQDFEDWRESIPEERRDELNEEEEKEWDALAEFMQKPQFMEIEGYKNIQDGLARFTSEKSFYQDRLVSSEKKKLLNDVVFEKESWRNILPEGFPGTVSAMIATILILGMIVMALFLPTPFVKDTMLKIKSLQWASRKGRSLVATQYIATQLASFVILTGVLCLFLLPLVKTNLAQFFNNGLNSFFTESFATADYSLFDFNVSGWMWLLILLVYLIGLSFSSVLFFTAQHSKNYFSLLLKVIPLLTFYIIVGNQMVSRGFYINNYFYKKTGILWIEMYLAVLLFIVGIVIGMIPIFTSRKQDLLTE